MLPGPALVREDCGANAQAHREPLEAGGCSLLLFVCACFFIHKVLLRLVLDGIFFMNYHYSVSFYRILSLLIKVKPTRQQLEIILGLKVVISLLIGNNSA